MRPLILADAPGGVSHYWIDDGDGNYRIASFQDTDAILDQNKAKANHNDGYSPSRDLRRVAEIPWIIWLKWKQEEGWDALNPRYADRLARKLNDPDWAHLRTAPGHLAVSNGVMR